MPFIATLLGLFGITKFILDRAVVYSFEQMALYMKESLKNKGAVSSDIHQRFLAETSAKLWRQTVGQSADPVSSYGVLSPIVRLYQLTVPKFIRWGIAYPVAAAFIPYRWLTGQGEQEALALQRQTRDHAIQGLWSFIAPAALGLLAAYVFVREVEYVQVYGDNDLVDEDYQGRVIKRIMVGCGYENSDYGWHPPPNHS